MGETINELRHEHGASEETLKGVFPPSWVAWAIEQPGENGMRQPTVVAELAAHDGESTTTRKAQHKLGKAANKIRLDNFMESLHNLPEEGSHPRKTILTGVARTRTWLWRECGAHKDQGL